MRFAIFGCTAILEFMLLSLNHVRMWLFVGYQSRRFAVALCSSGSHTSFWLRVRTTRGNWDLSNLCPYELELLNTRNKTTKCNQNVRISYGEEFASCKMLIAR